jgi:DNA polymerase (family X)
MKIPEVDRVIAAALGVTGGAVADPGDEPAEPELSSLMQLPGLGAKRARRLYDELGIRTLDDLAAALATGRVQALRGFGADMQERLIVDLLALQRRSRRFALPAVEHHIAPLIDYMRDGPGVERIEVAGSFRRRSDTVGDVDLLAVSARPVPVLRYFAAYPDADHVEASDVTRGIIVLKSGLRVKLRVVPRRCFGATLHYLTGSVAHTRAVRQLGLEAGIRISEYGVFRLDQGRAGARRIGGQQEEDVFSAIGLEWVPPELREGRGEVEAARGQGLPPLITARDIRGDLHMRTAWSGASAGIGQMVHACQALGYEYCAVTDLRNTVGSHGLGRRDLRAQAAEIMQLRRRLHGFLLLHGLVAGIRADGSLDTEDTDLDALDIVVAAVQARTRMSRTRMTDRVIRALEHPTVDILAHPTGRLLGRREPYDIDLDAVLAAAASLHVAVELNAHPDRLDLNDVHARRATEFGAMVVISSGAASTDELGCIRYGIDQARRAWLAPGAVLNTMSAAELTRWLRRRLPDRVPLPVA